MRIGIDISRLGVAARTGTEHYTYELLAALARLDRYNDYTLYCNGLPAALPPLGANMALRSIPARRLWTHGRLSLEMVLRPPERLFVPAHVLPLRHPRRSVVTIHDLGYHCFPRAHPRAQRLYLQISTLWSARAARRLIAISELTKGELVRRYRVPPQKITVIHHGVAPRFRPIGGQAARATQARYGITAPYFIYIGTIQPRKNLRRLIEAFAIYQGSTLSTQHPAPGTQLVIAGKRGWLTEGIERRAEELGIAGQVRFTGYVADEEVPALLGGALAFVYPSLYEGFGMPALEAMACGTPVLTSNSSSLPEVTGEAALLVNPQDTAAMASALARLATDDGLRAELRERGLRRAASFTWERCAGETLGVVLCP
jgi:glycosyltransferase involved in cell wall biosynthesis